MITVFSAKTAYITLGLTWENSFIDLFNALLRDYILNRKTLNVLVEAMNIIEILRRNYNTVRPHQKLVYKSRALTNWNNKSTVLHALASRTSMH